MAVRFLLMAVLLGVVAYVLALFLLGGRVPKALECHDLKTFTNLGMTIDEAPSDQLVVHIRTLENGFSKDDRRVDETFMAKRTGFRGSVLKPVSGDAVDVKRISIIGFPGHASALLEDRSGKWAFKELRPCDPRFVLGAARQVVPNTRPTVMMLGLGEWCAAFSTTQVDLVGTVALAPESAKINKWFELAAKPDSGWSELCPGGEATLQKLRTFQQVQLQAHRAGAPDGREMLWKDCRIERAGFATEDEFVHPKGENAPLLGATALLAHGWLLADKVDPALAREVARIIAGIE
jgi:hypothetical protein